MSRPNPIAAIIDYLKADAGLSSLVNDRVYGMELPAADVQLMPRKCIVIQSAGGPGSSDYTHYGGTRIDVRCYGETSSVAYTVYLAAAEALKQMERNVQDNTLLHNAIDGGGPSFLREPGLGWPFILSSWILNASEVSVS